MYELFIAVLRINGLLKVDILTLAELMNMYHVFYLITRPDSCVAKLT